jgi:hypothetical protein
MSLSSINYTESRPSHTAIKVRRIRPANTTNVPYPTSTATDGRRQAEGRRAAAGAACGIEQIAIPISAAISCVPDSGLL